MPNVGPTELAIVLGIALLIFGPKKLPELGRGLGSGLREFKEGVMDTKRAASAGEDEQQRRVDRV